MKMTHAAFLGLLIAGLIILPASGSAGEFGKVGQVELGGTVGFSSVTTVINGTSDSDALSTLSLAPYFGYFVTNEFEIGIRPTFIHISLGGSSVTHFTGLVAPAWNFKLQNNAVTPFLEGLIGYGTASADGLSANGISYGGRAGAKFLVGGNALVVLGVEYTMDTRNQSGATERTGTNNLLVSAGFTVFVP